MPSGFAQGTYMLEPILVHLTYLVHFTFISIIVCTYRYPHPISTWTLFYYKFSLPGDTEDICLLLRLELLRLRVLVGLRELISNGVGGLLLLLPPGLAPQVSHPQDLSRADRNVKTSLDFWPWLLKKWTSLRTNRFFVIVKVSSLI